MSAVGIAESSMRLERAESSRLAWAFGLSLAMHLLIGGSYETGKRFGWWQHWRWPAWVQSVQKLAAAVKKKENPRPQQAQEIPLMFVDVSPAQATAEPPKKSAYYSDKNSRAANPDAKVDTEAPTISGKQTQIVKTEDVPRAKTFPLQPSLPADAAREAQDEIKPRATHAPGDLTMAKPEQTARTGADEAKPPRPKTVAEAKARQPNSRLSGEKMKQDGGVKRRGASSLDVTATGFGAYDAAIIAAVQNRWYDLLDSRNYAGDANGKVSVKFRLHSDGKVSGLALADYTVDFVYALLCKSAIEDNNPYAAWPADMKREIGADYREVSFVFYYH